MNLLTETIRNRQTFCKKRIATLREKISAIDEVNKQKNYCIYATGSYARLEAAENSDLDLFFVHSENKPVKNISKTLIDAALIGIQREMTLPEFSGDGKFLEIHFAEDMIKYLGSSQDDFRNFFSARMLLLLESKPIFNDEYYNSVLVRIINAYYKDFHDHEEGFRPLFLVNDIIRFWKTLCLNYEHSRHRNPDLYGKKFTEIEKTETEKRENRLKAHRSNLKLRFSRKMTCFSFLLKIISSYEGLDQTGVLDIVKMTPIERLESLTEGNTNLKDDVEKALNLYTRFLQLTSRPIDWIENVENRNLAFNEGRLFGDCIFHILSKLTTGNSEILKYIVS